MQKLRHCIFITQITTILPWCIFLHIFSIHKCTYLFFSLLTAIILHKLFCSLPFFQPLTYTFPFQWTYVTCSAFYTIILFTAGLYVQIFKLGPYVALVRPSLSPLIMMLTSQRGQARPFSFRIHSLDLLMCFPAVLFSSPISYKRKFYLKDGLSYI